MDIISKLFALQDTTYRSFQQKLIPNIAPSTIIGVRTPMLRILSREVGQEFLGELPHRYFEENQLHALSLAALGDFGALIHQIDVFLPFVDNWATCDQLRPGVFKYHRKELLPHIHRWLASGHTYTIRFGIEMLMLHYLDDEFDAEYLRLVASVSHDDYYVRMMQAWYFATALALQYDAALLYITGWRLDPWVHNKTIQKAVESSRIPDERKKLLKTYSIK